jgi:hypothetical protein
MASIHVLLSDLTYLFSDTPITKGSMPISSLIDTVHLLPALIQRFKTALTRASDQLKASISSISTHTPLPPSHVSWPPASRCQHFEIRVIQISRLMHFLLSYLRVKAAASFVFLCVALVARGDISAHQKGVIVVRHSVVRKQRRVRIRLVDAKHCNTMIQTRHHISLPLAILQIRASSYA